jgi:hypothetical protein
MQRPWRKNDRMTKSKESLCESRWGDHAGLRYKGWVPEWSHDQKQTPANEKAVVVDVQERWSHEEVRSADEDLAGKSEVQQ